MTISNLPPVNPPEDCNDDNEHHCPNMQPKAVDRSFEHEHYECLICGRKYKLDYEEMK
jgi:hypothetical protein